MAKNAAAVRSRLRFESPFRHGQGQKSGEQQRQDAAHDDRQPQVDVDQADADEDADQPGESADLDSAQKERGDLLRTDLVGSPRLLRTTQKGLADTTQGFGKDDRQKHGHQPLDDVGQAEQRLTDDDRQASAIQIGQHTRGDFEDQDRSLDHGPDQHQLERIHADPRDEIHGQEREHQAADQPVSTDK